MNNKRRLIGRVDFGPVWIMSGLLGFFGEGYRYQEWLKWLFKWLPGYSLDGVTFVAKTTTLNERAGNMPLGADWRPLEYLPKCIYIGLWQWLNGVALNAVSLSGPGAARLFLDGRYFKFKEPFFLSFMSVESTLEARLQEFRRYVLLYLRWEAYFRVSHALQVNLTCPNVGLDKRDIFEEAEAILQIADSMGLYVPIVFKLAVNVPVEEAVAISQLPGCAGICVSNTLPFGSEMISSRQWRWYFPFSKKSPLLKRGFAQAGGLSGGPLLSLVENWVAEARRQGMTCHINAGGGILRPKDVNRLFDAGADSVSIGSAGFLRPWRLKAIIARAFKLSGGWWNES